MVVFIKFDNNKDYFDFSNMAPLSAPKFEESHFAKTNDDIEEIINTNSWSVCSALYSDCGHMLKHQTRNIKWFRIYAAFFDLKIHDGEPWTLK